MIHIQRILLLCMATNVLLVLAACGAPSEQAIQATVAAAIASTAQAERVAAAIESTQQAEQACGPQALETYASAIDSQLRAFRQQADLVGATPRVGLGLPLQRLLDIQSDTRKLVPPVCLGAYHERVVGMMELHQMAYQNFAGQGDEAMTSGLLLMANKEFTALQSDLKTIHTGTLPPTVVPVRTPTPS